MARVDADAVRLLLVAALADDDRDYFAPNAAGNVMANHDGMSYGPHEIDVEKLALVVWRWVVMNYVAVRSTPEIHTKDAKIIPMIDSGSLTGAVVFPKPEGSKDREPYKAKLTEAGWEFRPLWPAADRKDGDGQ